ncbi:FAD-dependent oxidoreductase [Kribbella sp. CA-245084]|uniref:FAD-dependent oxidoreductase n=1 Tax=Kribbella sp. CA-245084 TaxID=3239940 RepID=UPI003D90E990
MTDLYLNVAGYEVVVAGGGLAGIAAALHAAGEGSRVLVVDPTGTLGREVVRARAMFVDLVALAVDSRAARLILDGLYRGSAWFDGVFDPMYAALVFDNLLAEAGVDVLFHVWPVRALHHDGRIEGIQVASRNGYLTIRATHVVDTSRRARIAGQLMQRVNLAEHRGSQRFVFHADGAPWSDWRFAGDRPAISHDFGVRADMRLSAEVRPTYRPGEWRVSIDYTVPAAAERPGPLRADDLGALMRELSPLSSLKLIHTAEEPVEIPAFRLCPDDCSVAGLAWAGLWSEPNPVPLEDHSIAASLLRQGCRAAIDVLAP